MSGVVVKNAEPELGKSQVPLFVESKLKGKTSVVLTENISIPGRFEMLIQGHAKKTLQASVGMIGPAESFQGRSQNIHDQVAYDVISPYARAVPLKIMNTSKEPVELAAGTTVAHFSPLVTSGTKCYARTNARDKNAFSSSAVNASESLRSKSDKAIDPSLGMLEKQKLERLLLDITWI